ncbi:ABC transporter ATP-binding protein/permease [Solibacillus sp. MA9]|uniref:ABC transporter ATP-binding protein/permease n=1 Tax=Solibacillus palustris TaxID=2908203 RepID=A0ABS9UD78_9BACL|nr:ABC transporter ATP-binding protein [Solibacillus sp. MA9]MCH7322095.1 ABC transporter ATP-binding protein/permease [Solibacillus sp. MA9]
MINKSSIEVSLFKVYIWVVSFLKPYLMKVFLLIICGVVISVSELIIPKMFGYFIDDVLKNKNINLFVYCLCAIFLVLLLKLIATASKEYLQRYIQENSVRDLQWSIVTKLRVLGASYLEKNSTGTILALVNTEVAALQELYRRYFPEMIQHVLFVTISIYLMLDISLYLSISIIPCISLYYLFGPRIEKKASNIGQKLADSQVNLGQKYYESVSLLKELNVFNSFEWDLNKTLKEVKNNTNLYSKRYWYAYLRGSIRRFTYYFGAIILIIFGCFLISEETITAGEFVSFLLLYLATMHKLTSVITLLTEQKMLMFQASKLYEFAHFEPTITEKEGAIHLNKVEGNINFENVSFSYTPNNPILKNLSFNIKSGEKIAFVGESGCGKSTIAKLMIRFYDSNNGEISIDSNLINSLSLETIRRSIGIVFQDVYIFGSTIKENILFGNPSATEEELIEASKAAYLHDYIMELPDQYNTKVDEKGDTLSGGLKQRVGLARLFLMNPSIVIMDEPTSALDNITEKHIQKSLDRFLIDKTVITIAHRLSTIRDYDRIYVLDNGIIAESGPHEQLLAKNGLYKKFIIQTKEAGLV